MIIAPAPPQYDKTDQDQMRGALKAADGQNLKATSALDKLMFRDTVTGEIVTLTVASGAVVIT